MKHTDFSGSAVEFARRQYSYDRNGNRTSIEDAIYAADGQELAYDDLNRLVTANRGHLDSSDAVEASDVATAYDFDLLGNLTPGAGGLKVNGTSSTVTHATNETNEISTLDHPNGSGPHTVISDAFTTSLSNSRNRSRWQRGRALRQHAIRGVCRSPGDELRRSRR